MTKREALKLLYPCLSISMILYGFPPAKSKRDKDEILFTFPKPVRYEGVEYNHMLLFIDSVSRDGDWEIRCQFVGVYGIKEFSVVVSKTDFEDKVMCFAEIVCQTIFNFRDDKRKDKICAV